MKVTVRGGRIAAGETWDTDLPPEWTFEEEIAVRRLTRLRPSEVFIEYYSGGMEIVALALAIVGHMRAKPGESPDWLLQLKQAAIDIVADAEGGDGGPPADGGTAPPDAPASSPTAS